MMFCNVCGQALAPGTVVCGHCGTVVAGMAAAVDYDRRVQTLGYAWMIYGGFCLITGFAGVHFLHMLMGGPWGWMGHHGNWMNDMEPWAGGWFWLRFVWMAVLLKAAVAGLAGWGLIERAEWGRWLAIVVAVLCLLRFPFGTAMAIWTLVVLLGDRNAARYLR